jgi:hypothetical protein
MPAIFFNRADLLIVAIHVAVRKTKINPTDAERGAYW